MRKHIFGFALFGFIVGVSVFMSGLFYKLTRTPVLEETFEINYPERAPQSYQNCSSATVKIPQAVVNLKDKKLDFNFVIGCANDSANTVEVVLWFYVKDGKNTRYLENESVWLRPNFNSQKVGAQTASYSFKWLEDLKSDENLYVVPQSYSGGHLYVPEFDKSKATAILAAEK